MKLYHYPWSPFARKALLAARELQLVLDEVILAPFHAEDMMQLRERTFSLATIPLLLLDDGRYIAHSSSIVEYLNLVAGGVLVPTDPKDAIVVRSYDRLADDLLEPTRFLTWALRKPAELQNQQRIERMRQRVDALLGVFDGELYDKHFLFGPSLSMADIAPSCAISVLIADRSIDRAHLSRFERLNAWYDRVCARPAWKQMEECAARVPRPKELA